MNQIVYRFKGRKYIYTSYEKIKHMKDTVKFLKDEQIEAFDLMPRFINDITA